MSKSKTVQMRFSEATIKRVDDLMEYTGIKNRTQLVAQAIAMYHEIEKAKTISNGQVYIEYPDNHRERIVVISG